LENAFYKYGLLVEGRWWVTVVIATLIIGFSLLGNVRGLNEVANDDHALEKTWSPAGGRLRGELEYTWSHSREEWASSTEAVQFTEKDKSKGLEVGEGGDILNVATLEEMLTVVNSLRNVTFSGDGKTYTAHDLCARQVLPDISSNPSSCEDLEDLMDVCNLHHQICSGIMAAPPGPNGTTGSCDQEEMTACYDLFVQCRQPMFPCLWSSALECFSEALEYQHPTWQYYETGGGNAAYANLTQAMFERYWRGIGAEMLLYSKRPSFRTMSQHQIRKEVLDTPRSTTKEFGCDAFVNGVVIPAKRIVGGDGEAALLAWDHDAGKRVSFRMKDTKPAYANVASIEKAKKTIPYVVGQELGRLNDKLSKVRVSHLESDAFQGDPLAVGLRPRDFILSLVFLIASLMFFFGDPCSPFTSHVDVAVVGALLVLSGIPAGIGLISWLQIPFAGFNWQTCPFLALGLGVNDLILLITVFCHVDRRGPTRGGEVAIVMMEAGSGISLTSVCNVVVFSLGSLVDIPGISSFCACAAVFAAMNWVIMILVGPALLVYDNWRINNLKPELLLYCFHARKIWNSASGMLPRDNNEAVGVIEFGVHKFVSKCWSHVVANLYVRVSLTSISVGLLVLCFIAALGMDVGYEVHELFPAGSPTHYALKAHLHHFTSLDGELCFKDSLDWPNKQVQVIDLIEDIRRLKKSNGKTVITGSSPVWLKDLANYGRIHQALCSAQDGTDCENFNDFDGSGNSNSPVYRYQHPVHAPAGLVDPAKFYTVHAGWATWPPQELNPPFYVLADRAGVLPFALQDNDRPPAPDNRITYACYGILAHELIRTPDYIEAIDKVRKAIDDSPLKDDAYPAGVMYTFWEIFGYLWVRTWILMAVMVGVIFCCCLIFTRSLRTSFIVSIGSFAIVVEIWGIISTFLRFSFFVSTPLIMAGGLSIEFTAHIGSIFARQQGSLRDRLNVAMQIALVPVWMGALTTIFSILPLAWSPIPFIVKYFFLIFVVVEVVGLLNACVFLPAMLACLLPSGHLTDVCMKTGVGKGSAVEVRMADATDGIAVVVATEGNAVLEPNETNAADVLVTSQTNVAMEPTVAGNETKPDLEHSSTTATVVEVSAGLAHFEALPPHVDTAAPTISKSASGFASFRARVQSSVDTPCGAVITDTDAEANRGLPSVASAALSKAGQVSTDWT
jgi:hypothetical protein